LEAGTVYIILKVHVSPVGQASVFIGLLQLKILQLTDVLVVPFAFVLNLTLTNSTADNFHLLLAF